MNKYFALIAHIGMVTKIRLVIALSASRIKFNNIIVFIRDLIFLQFYKSQLLKRAFEFSFLSLSVVFLTALCTGAVLTLQTYSGLGFFATPNSIAKVVVPAIIRELGPVLTALMVTGRISSSIAAEISTMKTTDQINALTTLSINPIKYLVLPRVFVGITLMPFLLLIGDVISILGSFLIVTIKFDITPSIYIVSVASVFEWKDLMVGIVKSLVFGGIITTVGCAKGLNSSGDSAGVGVATTEAVVLSSVLILFLNYFLTLVFF
jgi:phospholipid/cholesterol/gamma-HCH transport system permease protein